MRTTAKIAARHYSLHNHRHYHHTHHSHAFAISQTQSSSSSTTNIPQHHHRYYLHLVRSCKHLNPLLQIHAHLVVSGLFTSNCFIQKCILAQSTSNSVTNPSLVLWNSMIRAYSKLHQFNKAINLYHRMLGVGFEPDKYTFTFVLKACTGALDFHEGVAIHQDIASRKLGCDVFIGTGLVDMYCKMGHLYSARKVFDEMPVKDVASWNAMISGLSQSLNPCEAMEIFRSMQMDGVEPDSVSILNLAPAVSRLEDADSCKSIHGYVVRRCICGAVSNSLIDMYSKCGEVNLARRIFEQMQAKDDVSLATMMAGYVQHGCFLEALSVLSACRHAGLIEEGRNIFQSMREKHNLEANMEHYACMIDLFGRAGLFDEVSSLINKMPTEPDAQVWGALLGACKIHSNVKLGEVALHHLLKLEPRNAAHYVVLSGIYAQCGRWIDSGRSRSNMNDHGLKKSPGYSWVGAHKQGSCHSG